ncbi:MAG: hypothetical protein V5A88_07335 [Candidatus Thermoplasmatota archaeon]
MSWIPDIFKKKDKPEHYLKKKKSFWYYLTLTAIAFLILNLALLGPLRLYSLLFQFYMLGIQFARMPRTHQTWFLVVMAFFFSLSGHKLIPRLRASSVGDRGETYFYIRSWLHGNTRVFKTLTGKIVRVNHKMIRKSSFGFKYETIGNVRKIEGRSNLIKLETEALEVTHDEHLEKRSDYLQDKLDEVLDDRTKEQVVMHIEEFIDMVRNSQVVRPQRQQEEEGE